MYYCGQRHLPHAEECGTVDRFPFESHNHQTDDVSITSETPIVAVNKLIHFLLSFCAVDINP